MSTSTGAWLWCALTILARLQKAGGEWAGDGAGSDEEATACGERWPPPESWLRTSLPHASLTHLVIKSNGEVSMRTLGDSGHLPAEMVSF